MWRCWRIWVLFRVCSMAVYVFVVLHVEVEGDDRWFTRNFGEGRLEGVSDLLVVKESQGSLVGDEVYI